MAKFTDAYKKRFKDTTTGDPVTADTTFSGKTDYSGGTFTGKVTHRKDETPAEALDKATKSK